MHAILQMTSFQNSPIKSNFTKEVPKKATSGFAPVMVAKLLPLCASAGASFTGQKGEDDDGEPGFMMNPSWLVGLKVKRTCFLSGLVCYGLNHSWNILEHSTEFSLCQLQAILTGSAATALASLRPFLERLEVEATSVAKRMEMKDEKAWANWASSSEIAYTWTSHEPNYSTAKQCLMSNQI